ncbi:MAG: hypothetical protein EPN91_07510 [Salinibacterium sp.]|nr:MAG: hypothetical protein EPN91_07510 [Salinibacterium sp.]
MSTDDVERAIERVLSGKDLERRNGPIDPYDKREAERDIVRGRDKDATAWRSVMEYFGFRWFEPHELDRVIGPQAVLAGIEGADALYWQRNHTEGQWRSNKRRMAFTLKELAANYVTPEAFASWLEDHDLRKAAARAGLVLPPRKN